MNYNRDWKSKNKDRVQKIYCDMSRVCEVEDQVLEWYEEQYFQRQNEKLNLDIFKSIFKIEQVQYGGIDGLICKVQLLAASEGKIDSP